MVQLANSILGTLNSIGRGQTPQSRVTAAQKNELDQQTVLKQRYQNLMGDIDTAGNFITYDTMGDGQIAQVDVSRLMKERPDLVLASLNMDPAYNTAVDEKGTSIQTEVSDIVTNEDGSFSAVVTRPDGRQAPLTQNRTAEGDDIVAKINPNEFKQIITNNYLRGITRGGKENAGSFLRDQGQVNKLALQETVLSQAADKLASDNSAMANFYRIVNLSDEEGLRTIAADFGVDLTGLETAKADGLRAAEIEAQTAAGAKDSNDLSWLDDASGPDKSAARRLIDKIENLPSLISDKISPALKAKRQAELEEAKSQLDALKEATAANPIGRLSAADQRALANARSQKKNQTRELEGFKADGYGPDAKQIKLRVKRIAEADATIQKLEGKMSTVETELTTGTTVPLTAQELVTEIEKGTVNVTPEKMAKMRRYLNDNGITIVEDMRKLPSAKQLEVALIASVGQGTTNKERAEAFQKQLNFLQRGSMDYTRPMEVDDQQTGVTTQIQAANLRRGLDADKRDRIKDSNTAVEESLNDTKSIIEKLLTDDNRFTFDDEILGDGVKAEVSADMDRLVNMAAGMQGVERAAYQRAVINALIPYVAAEAEEQQGSALNPLNWPDKIMDLIARDSNYFQVGNMEDRIKINTEVVNGKTLAKSITFLDNQRVPTDITVDLDDLNLTSNLKRVLIGIPSRVNGQ